MFCWVGPFPGKKLTIGKLLLHHSWATLLLSALFDKAVAPPTVSWWIKKPINMPSLLWCESPVDILHHACLSDLVPNLDLIEVCLKGRTKIRSQTLYMSGGRDWSFGLMSFISHKPLEWVLAEPIQESISFNTILGPLFTLVKEHYIPYSSHVFTSSYYNKMF